MNHRHLVPNEIDLLIDGEVGFGVAPLRDHVRACAECRAKLEDARLIADALQDLPHLAPSYALAAKIMAQVPVFVPWHVAARDAMAPYLPRTRSGWMATAAAAGVVGAALTASAVWLASRDDLIGLAVGVTVDHLRTAASGSLRDVVGSLLGPGAFASLPSTGLPELGLIAGGFVVAAVASGVGLRAIATSARRRR